MKYTENVLNVLTAKTFKGVGDVWINKNLKEVLPHEVIVELLKNDKKVKEEVSEKIFLTIRENIKNNLTKLEDCCDGIVAIGDKDFPEWRGNVKEADQPNVLFYKGDLGLLSKENHNIAVIGVLNPDLETETDERRVVHQLVQQNAIIVSGLALGCDSIAHDQAIKSEGVTVAILPSTLNKIMPTQNKALADEIVSTGGLLITEYYNEPKSLQDLSGRYIKRDRLQALFSDTVLLSASYTPNSVDPKSEKIDSGSRHAMEKAKEYGIKRAIIYNQKYHSNPKYDLNRQIIKEDKKTIIIDPFNIASIDNLFNASENIQNNSPDIFLEPELQKKEFDKLLKLTFNEDTLTFKKDNKLFRAKFDKEILPNISHLIEYFLEKNLYSITIHNNSGFIKCFSDQKKQNHIMAIKISDINNEDEKQRFLSFFCE